MTDKKILNVIVYYNNKDEVEGYIDQVLKIGKEKVELAIVVNKDDKKLSSNFNRKYNEIGKKVHLFDFGDNVGYLNALMKVIKVINPLDYKYIILSNTDIEYKDSQFFNSLLMKNYSNKIGCIAPSVYSTETRSFSNPHYLTRISREKLERLKLIFSKPLLGKLYLRLSHIKANFISKKELSSTEVYSPHGCYMIFTSSFINDIRYYEYGVKLYSEESCIGELLLRHGYSCFYDSTLKVDHTESTVTGKMNFNDRFGYWAESISYILSEFY